LIGVQYWIIDSFIMDKSRGKSDGQRYERVRQESGEEGDSFESGERDDDEETVREESVRGKMSDEGAQPPALAEVNSTPIPDHDESDERGGPSPPR